MATSNQSTDEPRHVSEVTRRSATCAVPNSTERPHRRTAIVRHMPSEPFVDDGFPERWAAWQARGAAHDRATRRKLFVVAAILVLSVAILGSVWTF